MTTIQNRESSITTVQGIGIDAVDIARFAHWQTYSDTKLSRIFSAEEIAYCRVSTIKSAERFAARFAAREALYKALCQAYPDEKWLFLRLCKNVTISHRSHGQPEITVNWEKLTPLFTKKPHILLSLTHTNTLAMAWLMVQKV
jgi:phosphopantetheine--protein transferase-like protein